MVSERELSFDEQRLLQLEILKEIDVICKRESIRYSLAFGTLLGAIRHKGYIPWDDDLDIMMPYEDMLKLRENLHSSNIRFHDVETDPAYGNPFANVCSLKTYRKIGRIKDRGLGIDIYPIVKIPQDSKGEKAFFEKAERLQKKRRFFIKMRKFFLLHFSINMTLGYHKSILDYRNHLVSQMDSSSSRYYIVAGPLDLRNKMIYNEDLFSNMTTVTFENDSFPSIANYELFLSMRYGNYLELPPVEQRKPYHAQHYYWR